MKYEILELPEQKYVGIKTVIQFKDHDLIDFKQLHKDVMNAMISHIDHKENLMAMDADFTETSFSYTPLIPVTSYDDNDSFTHFTREESTYNAFEVTEEECGPEWFQSLFKFIEANGLTVEQTGYDLEYYDYNYDTKPEYQAEDETDKVFKILLKKK